MNKQLEADLGRFEKAQADGVYARALAEVRRGAKRSHWMWFIFPQLAGLGRSGTARHYGISGLAEAEAYLAHPVLGPRLVEITQAACAIEGRTARAVFGTPDDLKLRSCATLFAALTPTDPVFQRLLDRYYDGQADERTLSLLADGP